MTLPLRSIRLRPGGPDRFPFTLPVIASLEELEFSGPVTFFVGENGSGKSTLLEGIACAVQAIVVGGQDLDSDPTLQESRDLARRMTPVWSVRRPGRGFFLRAEDFFGFGRRVSAMKGELEEMAGEFAQRFEGAGRDRAVGAVRGQLAALSRYGPGFEHLSHGEGFLKLFEERFVPGGLYLLDEPETPLSPQRQLSLLALLKGMVEEGAQFVVATHSPILMAFPGATILSFDAGAVQPVAYEDVEHVRLTRDFLKSPERYLRYL